MVVKMLSKVRKYHPEHIIKPPVYYPVAVLTRSIKTVLK